MLQQYIENRTFDEIQIGDSTSLERRLTLQDIKLFALMSGDVNPAHADEDQEGKAVIRSILPSGSICTSYLKLLPRMEGLIVRRSS